MTNMRADKTDTILSFRRPWILAEGSHMKEGYRKKKCVTVLLEIKRVGI